MQALLVKLPTNASLQYFIFSVVSCFALNIMSCGTKSSPGSQQNGAYLLMIIC